MRKKLEQQQGLLDTPAEATESDFLESIARAIFRKGGGLLGELVNPTETGLDEGYLDDQGRLVVTEPLVRERNFRNWFGDSKVVDEEGKPLVMYHGTTGNFSAFDPLRSRASSSDQVGTFFSRDPQAAALRGKSISDYVKKEIDLNKGSIPDWLFDRGMSVSDSVVPTFVSIKNPLRVETRNDVDAEIAKRLVLPEDKFSEYAYEYDWMLDHFPEDMEGLTKKDLADYYTNPDSRFKINKMILEGFIMDGEGTLRPYILDSLQPYDGFIIKEDIGGKDGKTSLGEVYVPFEPTQIKSIHNRGTYNPDDPDLLGANTWPRSLLYS